VCDLEVIGVSSILRLIRSDVPLVMMLPSLAVNLK
jgi:hypothetical protein